MHNVICIYHWLFSYSTFVYTFGISLYFSASRCVVYIASVDQFVRRFWWAQADAQMSSWQSVTGRSGEGGKASRTNPDRRQSTVAHAAHPALLLLLFPSPTDNATAALKASKT